MSDNVVSGLLSAVLCGVTGYGFYKVAPQEHPYAFAACVIGFCHGAVGLISVVMGEGNDLSSAKDTSTAVMELVPLPLVNIELFLMSESNNIALGHGLFIVPLAINMLLGLIKDGGGEEGEVPDTLKKLTILGNITSLAYLCANDNNWIFGGMALAAYIAKYGSEWLQEQSDGTGPPTWMLGYSAFFFMAAEAVGGSDK